MGYRVEAGPVGATKSVTLEIPARVPLISRHVCRYLLTWATATDLACFNEQDARCRPTRRAQTASILPHVGQVASFWIDGKLSKNMHTYVTDGHSGAKTGIRAAPCSSPKHFASVCWGDRKPRTRDLQFHFTPYWGECSLYSKLK